MLFAIRDDDTSFWTRPDELSEIYDPLWQQGIPVSLAVIPFSVRSFSLGDPDLFYQEEEEKGVAENSSLVSFLKEKIEKKLIDVMQHGYSHQYFVRPPRGTSLLANKENADRLRQNYPGKELFWVGEYAWKDPNRLLDETQKGKTYLEKTFQQTVQVFVPPSNQLGAAGAKAVDQTSLNISGILGIFPNRPPSLSYLQAYFRRWFYWARYQRIYPHCLTVSRHKELIAYALTPRVTWERLKENFLWCESHRAPFVIATHYWELSKHPELREILMQCIDFAAKRNVQFVPVSKAYAENL